MISEVLSTLGTLSNGYDTLRDLWARANSILVVPEEIAKLQRHVELLSLRIEKLLATLEEELLAERLTDIETELLEAYVQAVGPLYEELNAFVKSWIRKLPQQDSGRAFNPRALRSSIQWDFDARQKVRKLVTEVETQIAQADEIFEKTIQKLVTSITPSILNSDNLVVAVK